MLVTGGTPGRAGERAPAPYRGDQHSVGGAAEGLTVPAEATSAVIRVENGPIRYYKDGRTPTARAGLRAFDRDVIVLATRTELLAFRAIRTGVTNGDLEVEFCRVEGLTPQ